MIIGCDIGGVVKEMISDDPIYGAIESIKNLEINGHEVIFISKCKKNFQYTHRIWHIVSIIVAKRRVHVGYIARKVGQICFPKRHRICIIFPQHRYVIGITNAFMCKQHKIYRASY